MTVLINIGRRLPRSWFRRGIHTTLGFISFQENIWLMIKQSLNLAKKKANVDGRLKFILTNEKEPEDMHYEIQWIKIVIQGTKEEEEEEYNESMMMYSSLGKILKKEISPSEDFKKHFKTRILNTAKVKEAYEQGYGVAKDNNISNKLLEMGILTHIEWVKDFDIRQNEIKPDF